MSEREVRANQAQTTAVLDAVDMEVVGHHHLDGLGDGMHVNVSDGYAYFGHMGYNHLGTSILDVSDPSAPRVVAQIPRPPGTHSHKVQVVGDIMVVNHERNRFESPAATTWSAGLAIFDVSRPDRPRQIGFLETPGVGVHRMTYWEPPFAYVSATAEGFSGRILHIVDLSDPSAPKVAGRWWMPGQHVAADEPRMWSDPPGRQRDVTLHHGLPRGDRLYAGWWDAGLVILDIGDPEHPTLVSHLDLGADSGNTHTALPVPGRDLLVVTDEQLTAYIGIQRHVRVVDIADESNPTVVSYLPEPTGDYHERKIRFGPHNLHEPRPGSLIDSDVVYLTYFAGGVRAYDISDPANPAEAGHLVPGAPAGRDTIQINDVTVLPDRTIYATDRHGGGLYVLRHRRD